MGRLVQQPPPAGTHREHPASRSRDKLLCGSGKIRHGRVTKINQPPANPARFKGFSDTTSYSVSVAGDVTGDGIDDLLISAYGGDPGGRFDAGEVYLLSGADLAALDIADGTADFVIQLANINATGTSFRFNGIDAGDRAGLDVTGIGDVDNDGRQDLVISAPRSDPNGPDSGETYLISGADLQALDDATANGGTAGDGTIELADVAAAGPGSYQINGVSAGDFATSDFSSILDFNGDGIQDVLFGVGDAGNVYVLSGAHLAQLDGNGDGVIELADAPLADEWYKIEGTQDELFGLQVDGSTIGNILISAIEADPNGQADAGQVYLVAGSDLDTLDDATTNGGTAGDNVIEAENISGGASSYQINGSGAGDLVGRGVAFVGDVTGDGIEDFLIGAPGADPNGAADAGEAYLISGADLPALDAADGVVDGIIEIANVAATGTSYQFNGETAGDNAGWSVSEVGDVDGDGLADLLIGAPFSDAGGADSGAVYFISGGDLAALDAADGTVDGIIGLEHVAASGAASYQINGIDPGDWAGLSIDGNGDPTNDTVNDLLIGAQRADPNGNSGAGETYLLSGSDLAFLDAADGTSDGVIDLENANMRIPGFADSHSNGTRTVIPGCADKVRAGC